MGVSSTLGLQSQLSEVSSGSPRSSASWLSLAHRCKGSPVTPATHYSSRSWGTSGHGRSPRVSTIDLGRHPLQTLRRKNPLLSWSLFRSKRHRVERPTPANEICREVRPRWWLSASSVTRKDSLRISPPIPLPPESLRRHQRLSHSDSQPLHHEPRGDWEDKRPSDAPPILPPKSHDEAQTSLQLADLDPDKRGPAFARIHADGWSKIIPKKWMEDQFSDSSSDAGSDDGRSVYSQRTCKEVIKCRLVGDPFAFEIGEQQRQRQPEALPPSTEVVEQPAAGAFGIESMDGSQEPDDLGVRCWHGDSRAGSASSDPFRYWMSSLRALPEADPPSRTRYTDGYEADRDDSGRCESKCRNKRPPQALTDLSPHDRESQAGLETSTAVDKRRYCDADLLVPQPLRLSERRRDASPAAAAANSESDIPCSGSNHGHLCIVNNQRPEAKSLQSSWSTIYCGGAAGDDDTPAACGAAGERQVAHRPATKSVTTNNRDKALPPLPSGCSDSACSSGHGRRQEVVFSPESRSGKAEQGEMEDEADRDRRTADIDEILDMYLRVNPGSELPIGSPASAPQRPHAAAWETADGRKEQENKRTNTSTSRSRAKHARGTHPPIRPTRSFATDLAPGVTNRANAGKGQEHTTTPPPPPPTISCPSTASVTVRRPCAYDPAGFPELRHGRDERPAPGSGPADEAPGTTATRAAAVTVSERPKAKAKASVDEDGQIWI